jgi:two-component system OmpR family response regulator
MLTIWYVRGKRAGKDRLVELAGDFAVRGFQSWDSFIKLSSIESSLPTALVLDGVTSAVATKHAWSELSVKFSETPIMLLNANLGADFGQAFQLVSNIDEVELARLIRVTTMREESRIRVQGKVALPELTLDMANREISFLDANSAQSLTPKECGILGLLMRNRGVMVQKQDLKTLVWNDAHISESTVDSHVSRLRKKISPSGLSIESEYGGGYILR